MPGNATKVTRTAREPLVAAAKRHNMVPIAVMVASGLGHLPPLPGLRQPVARRPRLSLTPGTRPHLAHHPGGSCLACHCLPDFPCTDGCTIDTGPVIRQPLCTRCRSQHSPEIWQQLAAIAYGTARQADTHDEQDQ